MILCVCNALSEDEVRGAPREGAATPEAAYAKLGCDVQCGTCLCYAQETIDEEIRQAALRRPGGNVVRLRSAA